MPENKRTRKRRYVARLLQELADSGLSVREFARKRRLGERGLRRWITMSKRGTWVPDDYLEDSVEPVEIAAVEGPPAEVTTPGPQAEATAPLEIVPVAAPTDASTEPESPTILPVTLIASPSSELAYELTFGGRLLRLPRDFEVHRVARLVRALEAATC